MEKTQEILITKLKFIIKQRFKNQKTFCHDFGISESQLSQLLGGKHYIGIELLDRIAKHCSIHISYFFNDDSNASIMDEDLFNKVFVLAYELADEHHLEINGSYFLGCYDMVVNDMIKSKVDYETAFKNNQKLLLKLVKKR